MERKELTKYIMIMLLLAIVVVLCALDLVEPDFFQVLINGLTPIL